MSTRDKFKLVTQDPVKIENGKVLLKFNLDLLEHFEASCSFSQNHRAITDPETATKMLNFFKTIMEHLEDEFVVVGDKDEHHNIRYACKVFELLERTVERANLHRRHPTHLTEGLMVNWSETLRKWVKHEVVGKDAFLKRAVTSYFTIFELTNREENP